METSLLVGENFLEDPYAVRRWALSREVRIEDYHGEKWPGIIADWGMYPTHRLSEFMGFEVQSCLSFFRLNTEEETTPSRIHADDIVLGSEWASVIYLCTPEQELTQNTGTALWRHLPTLHDGRPSLEYAAVNSPSGNPYDLYDIIDEDGHDESKWQLRGMAGMKNNRIVVYPSHLFHSRFPRESVVGNTKETGRLVWVNFFKRV